ESALTLPAPQSVLQLGRKGGSVRTRIARRPLVLVAAIFVMVGVSLAAVVAGTARGPSHGNVTLRVDLFGDFGYHDLADVAAARLSDAMQNRIFLEPLLRGHYPDDVLVHLAPLIDLGFIEPGDLAIVSTPMDVLG